MSRIPTEDEIRRAREEAETIIENMRSTFWEQVDKNRLLSWEMQRSISNYIVIGSGAAIVFVGTVFYSDEQIAAPLSLAISGGLFFVSLGLSLLAIWLNSVALGNLAVRQADFAARFEKHIRENQYKFEIGELTPEDAKPPVQPKYDIWMFNSWEWTSLIVVILWLVAMGFLSFALLEDASFF
ncbi:MAG: hypothetical protein GC188_03560 [Alphaproteobacteria bacterium]|nr:hypothetical protein [Alphaproteobacteria bacterium]